MGLEDKVSLVVVDDDPKQRQLMEVVLGAEEYDVHTASNGEEAFGLVRRMLPSAVITDVMMPSLNGFELCRRLRNDPRTAPIPIIFVTARIAEIGRASCRETG